MAASPHLASNTRGALTVMTSRIASGHRSVTIICVHQVFPRVHPSSKQFEIAPCEKPVLSRILVNSYTLAITR
jgi:hypothetical protein